MGRGRRGYKLLHGWRMRARISKLFRTTFRRGPDNFQHAWQCRGHGNILKSQLHNSLTLQILRPDRVIFALIRFFVMAAVKLNRQLQFRAKKIHNELPHAKLTIKFQSHKFFLTQKLPNDRFRLCLLSPQLSPQRQMFSLIVVWIVIHYFHIVLSHLYLLALDPLPVFPLAKGVRGFPRLARTLSLSSIIPHPKIPSDFTPNIPITQRTIFLTIRSKRVNPSLRQRPQGVQSQFLKIKSASMILDALMVKS